MSWHFGRPNPVLEQFKNIKKRQCTDKYFAALNEIEQQIDKAVKIPPNKLYNSWNNISNLINNKNGELKECYEKQYIPRHLNKEDKIINFSKRCTKGGKCNNGNIQVKKPPVPKTGKKETCERGTNCENQIPSAGTEQITSKTRTAERNSITVSSPGPDPKSQVQKGTAGQESKNADVSTQPQQSISNTAPTIVSEVEVPAQSVNLDSSTSEENQAKTQPLSVSKPEENVLVTAARDNPVESITNGELDRGNSSEVSDSDKNIVPSKLLGNQTPSDNPHDQTNTDGKLNLGINFASQTNAHHNVDTAIVAEDVPPHGNTGERGPMDASAKGMVLDDVSNIIQHRGETTTSIKHLSGGCDNTSMAYADNENSPVRTLCNEGTREDVESFNDDNNILDTLKEFFVAIPNKDHIIQASAPMGIVMLLGLLFKFTPLWRVLTKKNRKKGAGIIEELNSVVQEPSIMDEERSIPFSYGSFEYSS
ncbi:variable surface protein Vir18, putative [Plasmodium vivax]|uniref:Variable surface protein Vir18, putative n=1 Tax=Plasmodium vivax (strain Salvador I) TaxID=126793 RepID=A5KD08_PLAVS|nr:variable surface protein Vir18, putative [Plasmodium vivax]EDL42762.1 variable surface protein Vir18, putative [Plasmodium vivax]|eukprot:XP_001612555.1 variable surface protein Vir18 [Plasmodium vivax Sal-1]